jgi:microcystin-dependent protein
MADPFLGEIRMFAGNFAPVNWMFCEGQILPVSQYTALYSLLGVQYGGNGTTNFALPNLKASVPIGQGAGAGLTPREVGDTGGSASVTLDTTDIPAHTHVPMGYATEGTARTAAGNVWSQATVESRHGKTAINLFAPTPNTLMSPLALGAAGSSQPHNNVQPCLSLSFIICVDGDYPQRP